MFCRHRYRLASVNHTSSDLYGPRMEINGFCLICGKAKMKRYPFDMREISDIKDIVYALDWTVSDMGITEFFDS